MRMIRPLAIALRCLVAALLAPGAASASDAIAIVAPDRQGATGEFVESMVAALGRSAPDVRVLTAVSVDEVAGAETRLVVAVGAAAQQAVAVRSGRPAVLATLTPRSTFERLFEKSPRATALYLDHPADRQIALLNLLPSAPKSLGVVFSPGSPLSLSRLRSAADRHGIRLVEVATGSGRDVAQAVQEAVAQAEFLLAHPDPAVFGPQTIQNILLASYRARVPLLGFSPAYTRAGALLSLHSSPQQLAEQAAELARHYLKSGQVPPPQYPRDYEVSVNRQVARSLGLALPAESALVERLRQKEAAR